MSGLKVVKELTMGPKDEVKTGLSVAPQQPGVLARAFGEGEAQTGLENLKAKDLAIPYIALLQGLSPQVMPGKSKYIAAAKPGMFLDSSVEELFDEMRIIPCLYRNQMVEWVPREEGGGFVASHPVGYEEGLTRNEKGQFECKNGNVLIDTRYFFCLLLRDDMDPKPVVLALQSTQIKKAKNWLTKMQSMRALGGDGKKFMPPMFSCIWKVSSVGESNQKGDFFGYKIEIEGAIDDKKLYDLAKGAVKMFETATVQVQAPEDLEEK